MSIRSKHVIFVMEAFVSRQYTENIPKSNLSQQCNLPFNSASRDTNTVKMSPTLKIDTYSKAILSKFLVYGTGAQTL